MKALMHGQAGGHTHTHTQKRMHAHKIAVSALRSSELLAQIYLKLRKWNRKYVYIYMSIYFHF